MSAGTRPPRNGRSYGLVLAALGLVTLAHAYTSPIFGTFGHYALYAGAVILSLIYAGLGPALATALLSFAINAALLDSHAELFPQVLPLLALLTACVALAMLAHHDTLLRARAEEKVRLLTHTAKDLGRLLDSASDFAICMLDHAGTIVHWSKGAELITGWSERDALGGNLGIFYVVEDTEAGKPFADLRAAMRDGRYSEERERTRADGSSFLGDMCLTSICDDAGAVVGFGLSLRDVSFERALYRRIHMQKAQLRSILSAVPEAMVAIDQEGRIQMFSAKAEQMFGHSEDEVVGESPDMLFALPWGARVQQYLQSQHQSAFEAPIRLVASRRSGALFPVEATLGIADTETGRWYTAFLRDLTEQEETRAKVEALEMDVLHGSRLSAMGIMASTLAHELNQPMTAMTNYLEGCRAQLKTMQGERFRKLDHVLDRASSEAIRAGRIISHIREFVARGETTLAIEDGNEIVMSAGTLVAGAAKQADVKITFDLSDIGPIFVDRVQVHQVLVNLINNALDAMRAGPCYDREIAVRTQAQDDEFVRISVEDHGSGLQPEVRDRLFDAFISTGKEGGLGLGLSICRTIVEAHGGRIWAETPDHGGTRFNFTLCRFAGEMAYAA